MAPKKIKQKIEASQALKDKAVNKLGNQDFDLFHDLKKRVCALKRVRCKRILSLVKDPPSSFWSCILKFKICVLVAISLRDHKCV